MRYRLRTLLIVLAIGPPALAPIGVWVWQKIQEAKRLEAEPGYLGLYPDESLDGPAGNGVTVHSVRPGSPAENAGLMGGDVICSINNKPCRRVVDLDEVMVITTVGSKLQMQVMRDGKPRNITVTAGQRPGVPVPVPLLPDYGEKPNKD